jgi:hypothetical protein
MSTTDFRFLRLMQLDDRHQHPEYSAGPEVGFWEI